MQQTMKQLILSNTNPRDLVIIRTNDYEQWYDYIHFLEEHISLKPLMLNRFSSDVSIISEKRMNELGWYKRE